MDVVKTNVEKINGQVDVTTQGRGSIFRLQFHYLFLLSRVWLSVQNLGICCASRQIQETINLRAQRKMLGEVGDGLCLKLRGTVPMPLDLDESLGLRNSKLNRRCCFNCHVERNLLGLVHRLLRFSRLLSRNSITFR